MSFFGQIREVPDVAAAFADLVAERRPAVDRAVGRVDGRGRVPRPRDTRAWTGRAPTSTSATSGSCPSTTPTRTRG